MKRYIFIGLLIGLLEALTGFGNFDFFQKDTQHSYTQRNGNNNNNSDKDKDKGKKGSTNQDDVDLNDGAEDDNDNLTFRPGSQHWVKD